MFWFLLQISTNAWSLVHAVSVCATAPTQSALIGVRARLATSSMASPVLTLTSVPCHRTCASRDPVVIPKGRISASVLLGTSFRCRRELVWMSTSVCSNPVPRSRCVRILSAAMNADVHLISKSEVPSIALTSACEVCEFFLRIPHQY